LIRRRGLLAGLAALSLTACHPVGPDYHLPDAAISNAPMAIDNFVGAGEAPVTRQSPPDRWWMLFADERLNGLVRQALAANTDLRVAGANIARARAALAGVEDARLPQTRATAGFEYSQLSGEQYLLDVPLPAMGLYDTNFGISYQIDLFGQIKRGIEAAQADAPSSRSAPPAMN
jgi:multidrug efflux system outer membrane protein